MSEPGNWTGISYQDLIDGVAKRQNCTSQRAIEMISDILNMDQTLRKPFCQYWETGEVPDIQPQHGYTLQNLVTGDMKTVHCLPIGAFLTLDWIITEPEKALPAVRGPVYYVGKPPEDATDDSARPTN